MIAILSEHPCLIVGIFICICRISTIISKCFVSALIIKSGHVDKSAVKYITKMMCRNNSLSIFKHFFKIDVK